MSTSSPRTFTDRRGNEREMVEPDGQPTAKQLYRIVAMLRANPEVKGPAFPRTKAEASDVIDRLKKKIG